MESLFLGRGTGYQNFRPRGLRNNCRKVSAVIIFLLFSLSGFSTVYYISSSSGNDSNSGTSESSAWRSLNKVNSFITKPGDQILFKRGDSWNGTLTVNASGTSGSPIVYGAYGMGDKPKIYGSEVITGWTRHEGNIWKAKVSNEIFQLFINDERASLARYPKTGFASITSTTSSTEFASTGLSSETSDYYKGAMLVGRHSEYRIYKEEVIGSNGNKIIIEKGNSFVGGNGKGFFLCDKLEFLTQSGEWHYDSSTNTVYVWMPNSDSPSNYEIRGSINDFNVYSNQKNYVIIRNLELLHAADFGMYIRESDYFHVKNVDIISPNNSGIQTYYWSDYSVFEDNYIYEPNAFGIRIYNNADAIITNNEITGVGRLKNVGRKKLPATPNERWGTGIAASMGNFDISYNRIFDCGYGAIIFGEGSSNIKHNYINGACQVLDDGGGIYTYNGYNYDASGSAGSVIEGNIVLNVHGNSEGHTAKSLNSAGIYLDNATHDVLVKNNLVAGATLGIFLHEGGKNSVIDNSVMDCMLHLYTSKEYEPSILTNNIIYLTNRRGYPIFWGENAHQRIVYESSAAGIYDYNTYIAPYTEKDVFANKTDFTQWKTDTGQDANSTYDGTDMKAGESEQLLYNDTKQPKTFNLGTTVYKDIYGKEVTGKLTLEPFTSRILIKTTKTVQLNQRPVIDSQSFNVAGPVNVNDFIGKVEASDPDAGQTLTYSIIQGNAENLFTIDASTGELYARSEIKSTEDQVFNLTVEVVDDASSPLTASAEVTVYVSGVIEEVPEPDILAPSISSFIIPAESNSLTVLISSFSASDNVGVSGYLLTESNISPLSGDAGWSSSSPAEYTFSTEGTHTLYAWVKDASGNVSSPVSRSVTITLPDLSPVFSEYLFEESMGVEVLDSECSNDGILVNDGMRVDGANGRGLELSGSGYISFGQCFGENVQAEVSMSAWIKPDAGSSGYQGIIMHGGPNTDTYALYIYPNTKTIGFKTSGTTSSWFAIDNIEQLWDGNWHHLVAVYNGTEKIIYLDNVVIGVISAEGTIDSGYGYNLLVGAGRDETVPTLLYSGLLDEVRIYNYAIDVSDVGELFHPVNRELNKISTVEEITICEGENYQGWSEAGQYERVLKRVLASASGADSVVTTNLHVNPVYKSTETATICEGETYAFGYRNLSESGEYTEVFETVTGCDSTVVLTLTVNSNYQITEDITIREDENYMGWTESGTWQRNLVASTGCDSIVVTNLHVLQTSFTEEKVSVCEGDSYNGWTTSGRYERTLQSVLGADSIVVTILTVNPAYSTVEEVVLCEGEDYSFGSRILTESGEYTEVFKTVSGCDSTVVLTLTVNPNYYITEDVTIYEGEDYNGWIEDGIYERNLVASTGCDSVVVTNLKVIQTLVTKEEISICEGSSYNGWTTSGRYERTFQSAAGGDSVVVTRLTVHPVYSVTELASICEGETYRFGSQLLTKTGVYTVVYETIFGCDSTVVLNLTVNPKHRVTENISIVEGEDYLGWTEPGVYERNLVASTGCDSVVVTNLSVEQLAVHTINLEAGWNIISSYLIPDNQDMVAVVESLIADGNLVKIQDESNNTLEQKNKNTGWVNSIGDFRETEGYKIQVNTSCALEVKGEKVNLPLHVSLTSGWNLISFPVDGNVNAMEVIQPLIDAGVLNKVQDEKGNSIENWRNKGWINSIGNFEKGKGYVVHVSGNTELAFSESFEKSAMAVQGRAETTYFSVNYDGNGVDHMNINIVELAASGLKAGDEIAVFDNDVCVGAIRLTDQDFMLDAVSIPASASEEGLNNGYLEGNSIKLKTWRSSSNEELTMSVSIIEGEMVYNRQASVFVALSDLTVGVNEFDVSGINVDVYPNPANQYVNVRFSAAPDFGATIALFDISGRQVLSREIQSDNVVLQLDKLQSGTYFVRIPVNSGIITRKLVKR